MNEEQIVKALYEYGKTKGSQQLLELIGRLFITFATHIVNGEKIEFDSEKGKVTVDLYRD